MKLGHFQPSAAITKIVPPNLFVDTSDYYNFLNRLTLSENIESTLVSLTHLDGHVWLEVVHQCAENSPIRCTGSCWGWAIPNEWV